MDKLTKENFWDALERSCPEAMWQFKEWIDQYKKDVAWDLLFNSGYGTPKSPKYHDLPYAIQVGIFLQFVAENKSRQGLTIGEIRTKEDFERMKEIIREYFIFDETENVAV